MYRDTIDSTALIKYNIHVLFVYRFTSVSTELFWGFKRRSTTYSWQDDVLEENGSF